MRPSRPSMPRPDEASMRHTIHRDAVDTVCESTDCNDLAPTPNDMANQGHMAEDRNCGSKMGEGSYVEDHVPVSLLSPTPSSTRMDIESQRSSWASSASTAVVSGTRWEKQRASDIGVADGPTVQLQGSAHSPTLPLPPNFASNMIAHEMGAQAGCAEERETCNESHNVPTVPTEIGEYLRCEPVLGHGSFSTVFEGVHRTTSERVAIKAVQVGKRGPEGFHHEVRMNKVISAHVNVVRFLDSVPPDQIGPLGYLIFELCDGGELFMQLVPNAGLEPRARIGIYFSQLVAAVAHVHRCGVCHLDIKPENLLLCKQSGRLKLADFGLSTLAEDGVVQGIHGSRSYAAPENLKSKAPSGAHSECHIGDLAYDGQRADMWSVGVVLFLFLYGYTPWSVAHDSNQEYHMYKTCEGFPTVKPWVRMPTVFRKLFHHTLSIKPHKRWTADDLKVYITHDLGWRVPANVAAAP
eukprot:m.165762 g.165762  ORF g.165762 m.165762 type:complete len:466 (-) comp12604_c0_seq1:102-1499(-)